jgi:hypothetical protein
MPADLDWDRALGLLAEVLEEEIAAAARWCVAQDPGLAAVIREGLEAMGFGDALARLDL